MTAKRLLTAAISMAIIIMLGCALFFSCGDNPGDGDTLRWRSAIDIPVNTSFLVWSGLDSIPVGADVLLDLGTGNIPVGSDIIGFLKKFTEHKTDYSLSVTNSTGVDFWLYALLFQEGDPVADTSMVGFYNLLMGDISEQARENRIILLGGTHVPANGTGVASMPDEINAPLCNLVLTSESLKWRWLLRASAGVGDSLKETEEAADSIYARLRLRISGVYSFDSLLAM